MAEESAFVYVSVVGRPDEAGLQYAAVSESLGYSVLRLECSARDDLAWLEPAFERNRLLSAAVTSELLPEDQMWLAHEWHHQLVIDRRLDPAPLIGGTRWDDTGGEHPLVRVFRLRSRDAPPARVEMFAEFRASLDTQAPMVIEIPLAAAISAGAELSGEFADPRVGGAVALLMLSGANPDSLTIRLRNPAALQLRRVDGESTLIRQQSLGLISTRAVGVTAGSATEGAWKDFVTADALDAQWALQPDERPYRVVIELEANVDPEVVIPVGQVFEQNAVNRTQTLAVAQRATVVVTPGRLEPLILPAWCLNRELAPPAGEVLRPTPLRTAHGSSATQRDVWQARDAVMADV